VVYRGHYWSLHDDGKITQAGQGKSGGERQTREKVAQGPGLKVRSLLGPPDHVASGKLLLHFGQRTLPLFPTGNDRRALQCGQVTTTLAGAAGAASFHDMVLAGCGRLRSRMS